MKTHRHFNRGESGQTLLLGVFSMIILLVAIFLIFDVQNVLRGKVKAQTAVDAAAVAGANWQMHTLNLIGELNMVKATSVLLSDPFYGIGIPEEQFTKVKSADEMRVKNGLDIDREKLKAELERVEQEKNKLRDANAQLSQMQTRISFVGPMIGFGAAQQAAKNNGLNYSEDAGKMFSLIYNKIMSEEWYGNPKLVAQEINGYSWRIPYGNMLGQILNRVQTKRFDGGTGDEEDDTVAIGIAVGTRGLFFGMPNLSSEPHNPIADHLSIRMFQAIRTNYWCMLRYLLAEDFSGLWWNNLTYATVTSFPEESEFLTVHIDFKTGRSAYDKAEEKGVLSQVNQRYSGSHRLLSDIFDQYDPYPYEVVNSNMAKLKTLKRDSHGKEISNPEDQDLRYNILPELTWAVYDSEWTQYDASKKNDWSLFLRSGFRDGYDYSGAVSYFCASQPTQTFLGTFAGEHKGIGNAVNFNSSKTGSSASRIAHYENAFANGDLHVKADASAKPFGRVKTEDGTYLPPFAAGNLVLPVFTESALIPVSLDPAEGYSSFDLGWFYFLTEFIPVLRDSDTIESAISDIARNGTNHYGKYSVFVEALKNKLRNEEWRRNGIEWLDKPVAIDKFSGAVIKRQRDNCDQWLQQGGDCNPRKGPGTLH